MLATLNMWPLQEAWEIRYKMVSTVVAVGDHLVVEVTVGAVPVGSDEDDKGGGSRVVGLKVLLMAQLASISKPLATQKWKDHTKVQVVSQHHHVHPDQPLDCYYISHKVI